MAGFYAQVVLYSLAWQQIARAAGESLPFPGAPVEWTVDQQLLWSLHKEYRELASAVATWEGELPDEEILESPPAFRRWFDQWIEEKRESMQSGDGSGSQGEVHGFVIRE